MCLIQSKCMYFKISLYWGGGSVPSTGEGTLPPPQNHSHHFSKLNFILKILNFTVQINAYQEGTKINTEVNERPFI